jgi:transposase
MERYELRDFEWTPIEPHLPNKSRGVPRVDDRVVVNGIFWVLRSGASRADSRRAMAQRRRSTIASTAGAKPASGIG